MRILHSKMSATFVHELRVTYAECTVGNHVYYARYLDYLEEARGEFFRHLEMPFLKLQGEETLFPVVEVQMRYKGAARYDDLLRVELWLTEAHRVKLKFASKILNRENRVLVEGQTTHVCTGLDDKPKRLPEGLLAAVQPYLHQLKSARNPQ
jgi:acyl-CoA thioester hydrolase